jgi:hypothetical protein
MTLARLARLRDGPKLDMQLAAARVDDEDRRRHPAASPARRR